MRFSYRKKVVTDFLEKRPHFLNIGKLSIGVIASQLFLLSFTPIISRLYSPQNFGHLALFLSLCGIFTPISTLKFDIPIVLSKTKIEATITSRICLIISITMAILGSTTVSIIYQQSAERLYDGFDLSIYALSFLFILFFGINSTLTSYANRLENYNLLSTSTTLKGSTTALSQTLLAFILNPYLGLITGATLGVSAPGIFLYHKLKKELFRKKTISKRKIRFAIAKNINFLKYGTPQEVINAVSQSMPALFFTNFYSSASTGSYFFAIKILLIPSTILGQAIRQVLLRKLATNNHTTNYNNIKKYTLIISTATSPFFIPFILIGPELFSFLFGENWKHSGEMAQWLSLWMYAGIINIPTMCSLQATRRQKSLLKYEALLFISRNSSLALMCTQSNNDILTLAVYSIISAAFNFGLIIRELSFCKESLKGTTL